MRYEKIFWLEDNPYFLPYLSRRVKDANLQLSYLLSRVTFAYDFLGGERIVRTNDFDLYIINGDFPDNMRQARKAELDYDIEALAGNESLTIRFGNKPNIIWNKFLSTIPSTKNRQNNCIFSFTQCID